jgi:cobalt-zinc-cadmium efflux system outer membrane protein
VAQRLDQNQRLSATSYRTGEIGLLQLIVVNRQVLDGRRDLIEARSDLRLNTIALEAAAGWPAAGEER